MGYINKSVAVTLSFFVFVMCCAPCGYAAVEKKGSKIEIRMTKELPIESKPKATTSQWIKDHKWWLALAAVLVGGAAAAAGGGGGGSDPSDGGNTGGGIVGGGDDTGSVTVGW